ncbi:hypothetical protein OTB20_34125, partial [Streptomyces sp. H27-H1]|uniref:hypothetical protein n=1 Tax=Streptomyces sp. H27-H1 TaxID=2996461 RepID=UPI0022702868
AYSHSVRGRPREITERDNYVIAQGLCLFRPRLPTAPICATSYLAALISSWPVMHQAATGAALSSRPTPAGQDLEDDG